MAYTNYLILLGVARKIMAVKAGASTHPAQLIVGLACPLCNPY
jgi:hypothetical protein